MTATCSTCNRTFGSVAARAIHDCPTDLQVQCTDCGATFNPETEARSDHAPDCIIRRMEATR